MRIIDDIQELKPHIPKRSIRKVLKSVYGKNCKHDEVYLTRTTSQDIGVKQHHYRLIIEILRDYGYINISSENKVRINKGNRNVTVKKYGYRLSQFFKDILKAFEKVKVSNLTDRIKQFNSYHNTFDYLRNNGKVKGKKLIIEDRYIVYNKGKYKDCVYDSQENKKLSLFDYLRGEKKVWEMCLKLNIIG